MNKTQNMVSLLGGALLGATTMYLLDPETGKRRRQYLAEHAGEYLDEAGEKLHEGWDAVSHRARDLGSTIADKAQDYGQHLSDLVDEYSHRASKQARKAGSYAADYASGAGDVAENITDYGNRLWDRVRTLGGRVSSSARSAGKQARSRASDLADDRWGALPITVTGVGCAALGIGLMYLMDPRLGRSRRAWLSDKTARIVRRTGRSFYGAGRDVANRAHGVAAEARGRFQTGEPVGGETLLQRVRAQIGRVCSHARLIEVMADANGTVTLSGFVLAGESQNLISNVEAVRGVNLVINHLETEPTEQDLSRRAARQAGVPQI